jgi:hypothetical protein
MKKPITVCTTGLGHPEGPYELDDGRVIYANTYASAIGVWDPKTNKAGVYADVGGGPNACMLGSDGCVYSTQTPNVGTWIAPVHRPPSIQKSHPNGKVEILCDTADGVKFDGPNDLTFAPDGRLWFTDSGDWAPDTKPHPGRIVVVEKDGTAKIVEELDHAYPNGIVAEKDGSIVWVEHRPPEAGRDEEGLREDARRAHPGRAQDRREGQFLDHGGGRRRRRRLLAGGQAPRLPRDGRDDPQRRVRQGRQALLLRHGTVRRHRFGYDRPPDQGRCRRGRDAALPRRHRIERRRKK